jgi:3-carboxy-cis,cis-muconate cycloisomerase
MSDPPRDIAHAAGDPAAAPGGGLFDAVLARGPVRSTVDDEAWLRALLEVEAALAAALAGAGVIPPGAGTAIAEVCGSIRLSVAALGAAAAASGNPVVPLVRELRAALPADLAGAVHLGATSQDILDSAAMLLAHRALGPLLADLAAAAELAAGLAAAHRDTPMAGRTLLQQALPTTFGLKAATWMVGLDATGARLAAVRANLPAQFGGATGTWAGLGSPAAGAEVARRFAAGLGLAEPVLPWHTIRTPIAELAGALGGVAGVTGKVAGDLILLAQNEVAEVAEDAPGDSSAMAHKRNPVAAISAVAGAAQAPGLVATLLAAMAHEHERAAGAWHAEWRPLRELLVSTGSAVSWLRSGLTGLRVDTATMRTNLAGLLHILGTSTIDTGAAGEMVDRALDARRPGGGG